MEQMQPMRYQQQLLKTTTFKITICNTLINVHFVYCGVLYCFYVFVLFLKLNKTGTGESLVQRSWIHSPGPHTPTQKKRMI